MSRLKFVQHTDDVCAAQFVVFGDIHNVSAIALEGCGCTVVDLYVVDDGARKINSVRIPKVLDKSDLLKAVIRTTELYLLILSDTIDDLT